MLERSDITFVDALERDIRVRLFGDQNAGVNGLWRELASCQNWESYLHKRATILAFEEVTRMMKEVVRRMNEGEEPVRATVMPLYGGKVN